MANNPEDEVLSTPKNVELLLKKEIYYGDEQTLISALHNIRLADFRNFIMSKRPVKKIKYSITEILIVLQCNEREAKIISDHFNKFEERVRDIKDRSSNEE